MSWIHRLLGRPEPPRNTPNTQNGGYFANWPVLPRSASRLFLRAILILVAITAAICLYMLFNSRDVSFFYQLIGQRRFVVVIPADGPNPDLCKLITSAIALGYPSPVIVNWGETSFKVEGGFWGPYLGKISGTLEYLDRVTLPDTNKGDILTDDDLVLIVDAYDVWFQLPPNMLLQRYHESNRKANARLAKQWGTSDEMPMKQTVIVSAQKRCFPTLKEGSNLHCDAVPESDLMPDVYGPQTDANANHYHEVRPRFMNSGSFMGPAGDMKRYFRRVKERLEKGLASELPYPGDQGIFAEIWGEQEVWRQWRRDFHSSLTGDLPNHEAAAFIQRDCEFHIGLDYSQNLFLPTVYEENDGRFISLNEKAVIEKHSKDLGISPIHLQGVPKDLVGTHNPLSDIVPKGSSETVDWGDMPLYADFFTTAVPVVLHHNAWKHGLKERRTKWWDQTWYFSHLRQLLEQQMKPRKLRPLVTLPTHNGQLVYFAPKSDAEKRKPRAYNQKTVKTGFREIELDDVCRYEDETKDSREHWYDEVFRDGKGPM
ncbi:hypothetical protein B0J13DRAFT_632887 [Dactylonectria estremocensis]|uniref:Uncharacterized protein n=1 Tax=Dactylonectria estremocensis TaxID=1079267 RepID=A0A9P9FFZ4_9HYPO|nr:hypothetical protein B0J13DRAFT_632887 [Dactylonectria estremocensis]